jgi:hypothetical protein
MREGRSHVSMYRTIFEELCGRGIVVYSIVVTEERGSYTLRSLHID